MKTFSLVFDYKLREIRLRVSTYSVDESGNILITPVCVTADEFGYAIDELKLELSKIQDRAEKLFAEGD